MGIKEALANIARRLMQKRQPQVYADNETRDKYLRSLRRERRIQLEQEEKKMLLAQIQAYNQQQRRKYLYGLKDNIFTTKNRFKPRRKERWL
jgi:hypothetical protein